MPLRGMLWRFSLLFSYFPLSRAVYQWPSPQYEVLEQLLYEGMDLIGGTTGALASNCAPRMNTTVAAQWLRLAYHDMSTHNITAGTGGLDASIYYELDRAENIGEGMTRSMIDFSLSSNKYFARADIIAMGAVLAVASCGGPILPFRGGRVDALAAGRPGVPEPQQDLDSHIENFRLQGFNATEMASLVACGHTLGGVRNLDFPEIVPLDNKDATNSDVATFDSTVEFDATVVLEYLNGTTQNPLVAGSNETTRSDLRIFSHDHNATMMSMNTEQSFRSTCATMLTKMIDTVPAGVQLGDEIKPIPFKISARYTIFNGTLVFDVAMRVIEPNFSAAKPLQRSIRLLWCDRRGPNADCKDGSVNVAGPAVLFVDGSSINNVFSPISQQMNIGFSTYQITVPTTYAKSVGKFWFEVDDLGNGTKTIQQNNVGGGSGYQMPAHADDIVHVPTVFRVFNSHETFDRGQAPNEAPNDYIITAAIRTDSANNATVLANFFDNTFFNTTGPTTLLNTTLTLSRNTSAPSVDGYTFYSTTLEKHIGGMATADFVLQPQSGASAGSELMPAIGLEFVLIQPVDRFSILAPFANKSTTIAPLPSSTSPPGPASSSWGERITPRATYLLMVILVAGFW
ncbi:hypothetical protein D9619_003779 [Psilocybe cf. subviscida]|uniref:Peroxidase n=1 Tax=Psilocybe cf. subviscida TaxID=2480587 RepID=A0A8H5AXL6_9AGAR|nr:hypothetical protein D9619_003779 [Psilocybe cf. subviscida]